MRAEEIAAARAGDVTEDCHGLLVTVRGRYPRTVPVLRRWETFLADGLDSRGAEDHAFTGYRLPGYAARVIHQFGIDHPEEPTSSATRLRATWLIGHLDRGLPIDLLLKLAGLASATSLAPYVRSMTEHALPDHRDAATGTKDAR